MKRFWNDGLAARLFFALAALAIVSPADAAEAFQAGDQVVVARQSAPLMRGWNTLASLPQGQRLTVMQTQGEWVGASAAVGGKTVSGWVHNQQVATPEQYAAQRRTTRRYSYQPAPAAAGPAVPARGYSGSSSNRGLIMGATPYGPSYWRADRKIKGE